MSKYGVPMYQKVGYEYEGEVYCVDCGLPEGVHPADATPMYVGDEGSLDMTCDVCGCKLEETL